jgi:hypothetical protein
MSKVVLSYHSVGSQQIAWRIRDRLRDIYREASIVDDISRADAEPVAARLDAVAEADVLLIIVDSGWLDSARPHVGRLDTAALTIETALRNRIPIIPILVDGVLMPKPDELPDAIREFAFRVAVEIVGRAFDDSMQRIVRAIDDILEPSPGGSPREIISRDVSAPEAAWVPQFLSLADMARLYAAADVTPVGGLVSTAPGPQESWQGACSSQPDSGGFPACRSAGSACRSLRRGFHLRRSNGRVLFLLVEWAESRA